MEKASLVWFSKHFSKILLDVLPYSWWWDYLKLKIKRLKSKSSNIFVDFQYLRFISWAFSHCFSGFKFWNYNKNNFLFSAIFNKTMHSFSINSAECLYIIVFSINYDTFTLFFTKRWIYSWVHQYPSNYNIRY